MRNKEERTLIAAVDGLSEELGKVIRRALKADLDRAPWPLTPDEEIALAMQVVRVGQQLLFHSRRGQQAAGALTGPPVPTIRDVNEPPSNDGRTS
jgi:hypothetical protein